MTTPERPPSDHDEIRDRQMLGPGIAFLSCGITFLMVGLAARMTVFAMMAPAFIALGIVFLVRARKRPDNDDPR